MAHGDPSHTLSKSILGHMALITLSVIFLIPFAWLVSSSLKSESHLFSRTPEWIPRGEYYQLDNDQWVQVGFPVKVVDWREPTAEEEIEQGGLRPRLARVKLLDDNGDPIMEKLAGVQPPAEMGDMEQGIMHDALTSKLAELGRALPPDSHMDPVIFGRRWEIPVEKDLVYSVERQEDRLAVSVTDLTPQHSGLERASRVLFTVELPEDISKMDFIEGQEPNELSLPGSLIAAFADAGADPPIDRDIEVVEPGRRWRIPAVQKITYIIRLEDNLLSIYTDEPAYRIVGWDEIITKPWPTLRHYVKGVQGFNFLLFLQNTLFIVTFTICGTLLSCSWVAFGFSVLQWRGRDKVFYLMLATLMLPPQVTMIPMFVIFKSFGWINTYMPLIVPSFLGNAFFIFLLRQFFLTIPKDLIDAARVDGCSTFRIYWQIVLPLSIPALATVALFTFMGSWNDFMGPLIYVVDEAKYTLSLGLAMFKGRFASRYGEMMAVSVLLTIPIIVMFFFTQKTFIQGIKTSGMKG